jgi:hypothetical protein
MTSLAAALPAIHEMGVIDSHGNALVKSRVPDPAGLNYAEREYFRFHATHPDHAAFIGARVKSKVDGTQGNRIWNSLDNSGPGIARLGPNRFYPRVADHHRRRRWMASRPALRAWRIRGQATPDGTICLRC